MLRLLLLLILAIVLVRFLVRIGRLIAESLRSDSGSVKPQATPLVACRRCGVFVPRGQATVTGGNADGYLCRSCAGG